MNENKIQKLKYPIGEFIKPEPIEESHLKEWIQIIENLPKELTALIEYLSIEQLNWQYRPSGWTIKQVAHHLADSHLNAWIRFKLALTEDNPTIRPYDEGKWALSSDALENDIQDSLLILKGLHLKWAKFLRNLSQEDLEKTFYHPESDKIFSIKETIGIYAWHSQHHLSHIKQALQFEDQF